MNKWVSVNKIETKEQGQRKGKERKGKERKGKERKGKERKGKERKGKERKGKERKGKERKGKERKGKERKGKERKGKERKVKESARAISDQQYICKMLGQYLTNNIFVKCFCSRHHYYIFSHRNSTFKFGRESKLCV